MSQLFIAHKSTGVEVWSLGKPSTLLTILNEENVFDVNISACGKYLAVLLPKLLKIYQVPDFIRPIYRWALIEPLKVNFSFLSTYIAVVCANSDSDPKNLKVYRLSDGNLSYENVDKRKMSLSWTTDELFAYFAVGSEILFFEKNDFSRCAKKFSQKYASYSVTTNKSGCSFLAVFIRGQKAAPSMVKVFAYPHFENAIASQSLFKADEVNIKWNHKGDAMLIQTFKEVDNTGKSYYGETSLFYMDLKGTSCSIIGKKDGSVHSSEWIPKQDLFITISGRMPANVTLYNNRAEPIFQFGEASVNAIYINSFASLVAFTGFGNLSGDVHIWNLKTRTLISHFLAANTTCFSWFPDGLHMLAGTHYARLKVDNCFKTFDYLANQLCHEICSDSVKLFKLLPVPSSSFQDPDLTSNVKGRVLKDEPVQKYIPPHLRTKEDEIRIKKMLEKSPTELKEKKIKNLNKKLEQIKFLKKDVSEGKKLEKNQLDKISKELEIIQEIETLMLND